MMRTSTWVAAGVAGVLSLGVGEALAQEPPPAGGTVEGSVSAPPPVEEPVSAPPPALAPPPPPPQETSTASTVATTDARAEEGGTDHDSVVGRFAIGYMGVSQIPLAGGLGGGGLTRQDLNAPVIGARYWINRLVGVDFGVGLALTGGSTEVTTGATTTTVDRPGQFGMAFHGGVPLALAYGKHYTFEVIPEANFGFASSSINGGPPAGNTDLSGMRLDIGARAGAEVHFGFIGVPQLSLVATIGLYLRHQRVSAEQGGNSATDVSTTFGTSVQSDPWALFVNNISALYYF